jgi:IclR family transcriptional regulator, pca regulon regulatory protein
MRLASERKSPAPARRGSPPRTRTPETAPRPSSEYVQSFARGLAVIRAFGPGSPRMTLSEVAQQTGLTRAGARRILLTLQTLGYVGADDRQFFLTPQVLQLGYSYLSSMPLWDVAQPLMEALVERVRESCSVAVLDGEDIVYVLRVPTHRIMAASLSIGSRLPAFCTSMGRVLLAGLDDTALDVFLARATLRAYTRATVVQPRKLRQIVHAVRDKGWAYVDQELEEGLRSISVPIRDAQGRTIAAMNVSGQAGRHDEARMVKTFLPALQEAATRIERALRMRGR